MLDSSDSGNFKVVTDDSENKNSTAYDESVSKYFKTGHLAGILDSEDPFEAAQRVERTHRRLHGAVDDPISNQFAQEWARTWREKHRKRRN